MTSKIYGLKVHTTPTIRKPFIVQTASAKMPMSCRGKYGKVAVIETDGKTSPAMISNRAKGVVRIIHVDDQCHMGSTIKSSFGQAVKYAVELSDFLNSLPVPEARKTTTHDLIYRCAKDYLPLGQ